MSLAVKQWNGKTRYVKILEIFIKLPPYSCHGCFSHENRFLIWEELDPVGKSQVLHHDINFSGLCIILQHTETSKAAVLKPVI